MNKKNPSTLNSNLEITEPIVIQKAQLKPGYKTTEFYKSLALEITALATAFGLLSPVESELLTQLPDAFVAVVDTTVKVAGLLTALISQWSYTKSRMIVKKQMEQK